MSSSSCNGKVEYPSEGCLVEFLQGNTVCLGIVLESKNDRLRIYTSTKRELNLQLNRLLPWSGPFKGANLSRESMDLCLENHQKIRNQYIGDLNIEELWQCFQGELKEISIQNLSELVWGKDLDIDREAALGQAVLQAKMYFRFSPPLFEIFDEATVQKRKEEALEQEKKLLLTKEGIPFLHCLWDIYLKKKSITQLPLLSSKELETTLQNILLQQIHFPDESEDLLWKNLSRDLPKQQHLALCLALAWELVPPHYNYYLKRIGYESDEVIAAEHNEECLALMQSAKEQTSLFEQSFFKNEPIRWLSIDPASTIDRDDAFFVYEESDGSFHLFLAFACPSVCWDFGSSLNSTVQQRASSLYFPEGDEHMLPLCVGTQLFSLDEKKERPLLLLEAHFDPEGKELSHTLSLKRSECFQNSTLQEAEAFFSFFKEEEKQKNKSTLVEEESSSEGADWLEAFYLEQSEKGKSVEKKELILPIGSPLIEQRANLKAAWKLGQKLRARRIAQGAVILEQAIVDIYFLTPKDPTSLCVSNKEYCPLSHMVLGEFMISASSLAARWANERALHLIHRSQDASLPKEYAGVWTKPHEIAKIIKSLPPATLSLQGKRHAALGTESYAPITAPLRRYIDLLNQGQITHFLLHNKALFEQSELERVLRSVQNTTEQSSLVQRNRSRYWKLHYLAEKKETTWWDGFIVEETPHYIQVCLPEQLLFIRGKKNLFNDKITLGQAVRVRLNKINPLSNEIYIIAVDDTEELEI